MKKSDLKKVDFSKLKVVGNRKTPTIFLFRHGETVYNKKHIFTGWKDSKLTKNGHLQAEKIGKMLSKKQIDVVISSSLSRSKDTLKHISKYHPEIQLYLIDDRVIERNYGDYSGTSHASFAHEKYKEGLSKGLSKHEAENYAENELHKQRRSYYQRPKNGESISDVKVRVDLFIKELIKFMKKNKVNVAISAHGNSMRPFRKHFEKLTIARTMKLENPWDNYFEYRP